MAGTCAHDPADRVFTIGRTSRSRSPEYALRIGETVVGVKKRRGRCVMTTYDPDTLEQDPSVLRRVVREMGGRLGLDCYVVQSGRLAVGDRVELLAGERGRAGTLVPRSA